MKTACLRRVTPDRLPSLLRDPVDAETLTAASRIVEDVRQRKDVALIEYARRLDDLGEDVPLMIPRSELRVAFDALPANVRALLERTKERIETFALAQRECLPETSISIEGGWAGHRVTPVGTAGCYGPGGRFPLPSSILMTTVTARAAGVHHVIAASPRPTTETLAAAYIGGADALLAAGGAQAVAALAYGTECVPRCDALVGPGNRWVTAAKMLVSGHVGIDMLAGPSELVVFADEQADVQLIAADLLAQAEHDPDALPILVTISEALAEKVDLELSRQLETLKTRATAQAAVSNGFTVLVQNLAEGIEVCNRLAPEHLEVMVENPDDVVSDLTHFGAIFIGSDSAEVLGDYGAGPNHVLPTGGTARFIGGLSVFNFLKIRTWMRIDDPKDSTGLLEDAAALADIEGLAGHANAARFRLEKVR